MLNLIEFRKGVVIRHEYAIHQILNTLYRQYTNGRLKDSY